MTDQQASPRPLQAKTLRVQVDQEAVRKIGRDLAAAFDTLTTQLKEGARRMEQAREVGALFELYRGARHSEGIPLAEGLASEREALGRLRAAIAEYDAGFLADLITFGEFLRRECQPVWDQRAR
jgi:hypothetical protein